ncbi:MAG: alanine--tRNA ligase [bacterium]|nr:alanine--tRNA ligase [bacterium]
MKSSDIRQRFLAFFKKHGHAIIPSASLVPENDPSVLFTTAGMQPLVPYLLGQPHPAGTRIANIQKCVRTQDIDEIGDNTHDTFFEMLGNWSLGDYFKEEAIRWSLEFLTSKEEGLGLDPTRLYITVFAGDENAPRDDETARIWQSLGIPDHRIYYLGAESNWWSPGDNGPCGPDSEMFYDVTEEGLGDLTPEEFAVADETQQVVEIWNDVFMEYEKKDGVVVGKLSQKNVDTGAGLERMAMVLQGKNNIFETDLLSPVMETITGDDLRSRRIVADHIRTAVCMIADGVLPSNTDRGYILRRLLRRAVRFADMLGVEGSLRAVAEPVFGIYGDTYPLEEARDHITKVIEQEEIKFRQTLQKGLRVFEKLDGVSGKDAFMLFSTYGFPLEMTVELAQEKGIIVDEEEFKKEFEEHQKTSRAGAGQKFKGGLADHGEETVRLHTAHHLLLSALQRVLGSHVHQRGSNITSERLRIDFSFERKMTDEEKKEVEELVNSWISEALPVVRKDMPKEEAERIGAEMEFGATYGDMVSVYFIEKNGEPISVEFCGGPHISNTSELGKFRIQKEESVAAGVRRIKAVLE